MLDQNSERDLTGGPSTSKPAYFPREGAECILDNMRIRGGKKEERQSKGTVNRGER